MAYGVPTEVAVREARENGFHVVIGDSKTLLLDLDTPEQYRQFKQMYEYLNKKKDLFESFEEWESKSGNRHVLVNLKSHFTEDQRLSLQSILGSDPWREANTFMDFMDNEKFPIVLFRPMEATNA